MWFYADAETRALLAGDRALVLLYGGFEGFDNFGDILQLKSAIEFHRTRTGRAPVVVLSLAAWTRPGLLDELRRSFDADGFVFEDGEHLDTTDIQLEPVTQVTAGSLLHVYGGGYINRFWGARRVFVIEQLLFRLHASQYVLSGLQVDDEGARALAPLFALKRPLIIGGRDGASVGLLAAAAPDVPVLFSFDDALETIDSLRNRITAFGSVESQGAGTFGLHMNTTPEYMSAEQAAAVTSTLSRVRERRPELSPVLLQGYNDRRHLIRDTVETAQDLGVLFDEVECRVVNFPAIASDPLWADATIRRMCLALAGMKFVISSSYHIALTMCVLGVPSYLVTSNDYYATKRAGLSLPQDVDSFLDDPRASLPDYATERRAREAWLDSLTSSILEALSSGWAEAAVVTNEPSDGSVTRVADRYQLP